MENLEIIVLTSMLASLFLVFIISVFKELSKPEEELRSGLEGGPRAEFAKFVGKLFDEPATKKLGKENQSVLLKSIKRTIADMESDGIYFPPEVKEELEKKRKELTCEYSGLPSTLTYSDDKVL